MTNLISAWITYKQKKAEFKARQKVELDKLLEPYLTAFGKEIIAAQAGGKRIEDVEYEIGTKNRTLVYAAKRLAKASDRQESVSDLTVISEPQTPTWTVSEPHELDDDYFRFKVTVDDTTSDVFVIDGIIKLPDEWALDKDNQDMYRQIVRRIKSKLADN